MINIIEVAQLRTRGSYEISDKIFMYYHLIAINVWLFLWVNNFRFIFKKHKIYHMSRSVVEHIHIRKIFQML